MADGSADEAWQRWIVAQGGTADESALPVAPVVRPVPAPASGFVTSLSAIGIGNAAVHLGAGRRTKEDQIDHAVGIVVHAKRGDEVEAGRPLADVHAQTDVQAEEAAHEVLAAYEYGEAPPRPRPVLLDVIG